MILLINGRKNNIYSRKWFLKQDIVPKDGIYINLLENPEGSPGINFPIYVVLF